MIGARSDRKESVRRSRHLRVQEVNTAKATHHQELTMKTQALFVALLATLTMGLAPALLPQAQACGSYGVQLPDPSEKAEWFTMLHLRRRGVQDPRVDQLQAISPSHYLATVSFEIAMNNRRPVRQTERLDVMAAYDGSWHVQPAQPVSVERATK